MRTSLQIIIFCFATASCISVGAQPKVTFYADSLPPGSDSVIFVAGGFNQWTPGDSNFLFKKADGQLKLIISLKSGSYEYKFTQGSWATGELDSAGNPRQNRNLFVQNDTIIQVKVAGWQRAAASALLKHTASVNVTTIDSFYMPQLDRYRRIWIYLPANYHSGKKRYPVIYMHDGQNVFDAATSFSGEWGVDEYLDSVQANIIVVAVDNGGEKRMNEYNPWEFADFGRGEGDLYADFLVKTLKPFIDKNYRTRPAKKTTSIAGSSMGGLISLYAVLKYPDTFGSAGIFSPAFRTAAGIDSVSEKRASLVNGRLFFYAGGREGAQMVPDVERIAAIFKRKSAGEIKVLVDKDEKHNEVAWKKYFPFYLNYITGAFD